VEAPVGKVTLDADDVHDAAGTWNPLTLVPRLKSPLAEDPDASVHPPYTPVPPTAWTEDTATAAVRAVASRLTGRRMAR
jgi:hypothetical protein